MLLAPDLGHFVFLPHALLDRVELLRLVLFVFLVLIVTHSVQLCVVIFCVFSILVRFLSLQLDSVKAPVFLVDHVLSVFRDARHAV